jgi:hypothetical protein
MLGVVVAQRLVGVMGVSALPPTVVDPLNQRNVQRESVVEVYEPGGRGVNWVLVLVNPREAVPVVDVERDARGFELLDKGAGDVVSHGAPK